MFYLGFTGNYSDSGAILEPEYFIPEMQAGIAAAAAGIGWRVNRKGAVALNGAAAAAPPDDNRYKLDDISKDLTAGSTGNGTCAIAGLEFVILRRILMSLEADCNWVDFRKEKQRDPIFDPFSFGLSYRIGFRIWDCLIPYALIGAEYNFLRGNGGAQFREVGMIRYDSDAGGGGANHNVPATRLAYNLDHKRIMQSPRFGFGFELEFLKRFRFRCDCFWTNKSTASNFRTEVTSEGVAGGAGEALATSHAPAENKMNLRVRRFTTRFGIMMLF